MIFNENVKFYGTYRPYQKRVLDNLSLFLDNEKIHVVAAPGSGKTTLGLELILRLGNPSLVLVPSIAIREQWIDRFSSGFIKNENEKDLWISNDIKNQKPIVCITYQALYSAYKKESYSETFEENDEDNNNIEEKNDYKNFDLLETINKYSIKTICLDECHHLKSEWWKVLETLVKKIDGCKIIALTATPPYDSSSTEWQRYINLCGPIDEEIFVPELIKDNNLCPHQDYIYFSYPTKKEQQLILKSYSNGIKTFHKYKNNKVLLDIILSNEIYLDYELLKKKYYEDEQYYKALILYLLENNIKIPFKVKMLVHHDKFSIKHFETLLQYVMFDDAESYKKDSLILSMKKEFSSLGIVHNRKISLAHNEKINKITTMSLSKLESIKNIIIHENSNCNNKMKCLILTDYIKMKSKNYIGDEKKEIDCFGTVPIFEYLRRANLENTKLCCISGSICILPLECERFIKDDFSYTHILEGSYIEITIQINNRKKIVSTITDLFEKGYFNILIGTKALLGEGWDSPCINTLIMASFIGSYVLSNQMRGRAIRTDKTDPNKKSNVWHLVCLDPYDFHYSYDFYNLKKRFNTFVGIDLKNKRIENGIERLGFKYIPRNEYEANLSNQITFTQSSNREKVKETWEECINNTKNIASLTKLTIVPRRRLQKNVSFYLPLLTLILSIILLFSNVGLYTAIENNINNNFINIINLLSVLFFVLALVSIYKLIFTINPEMKLYSLGKATLKALKKIKVINSKNIKVRVKRYDLDKIIIYLKNASTYEQNIFSDTISQLLSKFNQPRYIIAKPKYVLQLEYFVIPDLFKKNKEMVKIFTNALRPIFGSFCVIFAKNEYGKNVVLNAEKLFYFKYGNVKIDTKNVMLTKNRKEK